MDKENGTWVNKRCSDCPYLFQCGVMVRRKADSCIDQIKKAIPGTYTLKQTSLNEVRACDVGGKLIATVNRGQIT